MAVVEFYPIGAFPLAAPSAIRRGREIIHLIQKYGLADLEPAELDDFLSEANQPKPPQQG